MLILPTALRAQSLLEPLPDRSAPAAASSQPTSAAPASAQTSSADADDGGQRLSQLFYQLQVLQQEVQELRGLIEEQAYQIDRLSRDQQEQYIDLDRRIAQVTTGGTTGGARPAGSPGGAATTPAQGMSAGGQAGAGVAASQSLGSSESERDAYTRAFELMKSRQFDQSAAAFNQLIVDYPNGQYTANAFYWLGELYLAQSQTEQARQAFTQVLNLYPDHPKVPDTLYKLGVVYHRMGNTEEALTYFRRVQSEYPNSSAAGLAARYMAELQ